MQVWFHSASDALSSTGVLFLLLRSTSEAVGDPVGVNTFLSKSNESTECGVEAARTMGAGERDERRFKRSLATGLLIETIAAAQQPTVNNTLSNNSCLNLEKRACHHPVFLESRDLAVNFQLAIRATPVFCEH